jgi:hypothetical protein
MRTKKFLNRSAVAGLLLGAGSLYAVPASDNWIEQQARGKQGVYTVQPQAAHGQPAAAESWMEQNHKVKVGTYSPAEEARIREVQSSSAFRQEINNVPVQNWIDRNRQVKQGQ